MFNEMLFLKDAVFFLKCKKQIEINGPIRIVVPDLYKVDTGVSVKRWVVGIKSLLCSANLVPIPKVKIQITAGSNQSIHLVQRCDDLFIRYIGKAVSGAGNAIELTCKMLRDFPEVTALQMDRVPLCSCFFVTSAQHGLAKIRAVQVNA